jgi:SsrA-binding protein
MKIIAQNRKAYHDYEVIEKVESGVALTGLEVKSIRAGRINLSDSYAMCTDGELFIVHMHISPLTGGGFALPDPYRKRKLLMRKPQIVRLCNEVERKQLTLIPLSVYFQKQWVKIEIGLCRGRKKFDKRQKIAEEESKRRIAQVMRQRHDQ